jgi:parvulin-like peptidyl-prolyl isomerase
MHLQHILLQHKYEAEDVQKRLRQGGDFAELAKKWSTCSSAASGGDLGNLQGKKLDQDFEEAALSLKPGEVSNIVRTRFGYHLIRRLP